MSAIVVFTKTSPNERPQQLWRTVKRRKPWLRGASGMFFLFLHLYLRSY
jgi:hypothetical protein